MRNYLLLIFLSISLSSFAQFFNQKWINIEPVKIIATYSLKFLRDSTNPSNLRDEKMLLFLGENTSKFFSNAYFMDDTITRKFTTNEQLQGYLNNQQRPMPRFGYQIYKNYPKGKITFTDHIPSSTYKFEEDLDLFHWKLTGDSSIICGYRAQMAICDFGGRSWIAWFSPEIPINEGPYKFNGLPGLIVKVYDTRNHYVFELLSVSKPGKIIMIDIEDKEYIVTTKQGFFQAEDSFREDIVNRAKEAGGDNQMQQTAAQNMARRNNPIELQRK